MEILIHDCDNYPQTTLTTVIAQTGYDVAVAVIPTFLLSSADIKSLPIKQRECYFPDEVRTMFEFLLILYKNPVVYALLFFIFFFRIRWNYLQLMNIIINLV